MMETNYTHGFYFGTIYRTSKLWWWKFIPRFFKKRLLEKLNVEKEYFSGTNLITNVGKEQDNKRLGGLTANPFTYVAVGTGTTTPSATDTALVNEVMRVSATVSLITTTTTNDTLKLLATFNFTSSYTIGECGVFDASSGGNMYSRALISPTKSVANGDSLVIDYRIKRS